MIRTAKGRRQAYVSGLCGSYGLLTRLAMSAANHEMPLRHAVLAMMSEHDVHRSTARRRIDSLVEHKVLRWVSDDTLAFVAGVPLRIGVGDEAERLEAEAGDEVWATCQLARRASARERQRRCRERKRLAGAPLPCPIRAAAVTPFGALTHKTGPKKSTTTVTCEPVTPVTKDHVGAYAPTKPKQRLDLPPPLKRPPAVLVPASVALQSLCQGPAAPLPQHRAPPRPPLNLAESVLASIEAELCESVESRQFKKQLLDRELSADTPASEGDMTDYPKDWPAPQTRSQAEVYQSIRQMQQAALRRRQTLEPTLPPIEALELDDDPPPGSPPCAPAPLPPPSGPPPQPRRAPPAARTSAPYGAAPPGQGTADVETLRAFLHEVDPDDAWRLNLGSLLNLGVSPELCRLAMQITREANQDRAAKRSAALRNPGGYCYRTAKALRDATPLPTSG